MVIALFLSLASVFQTPASTERPTEDSYYRVEPVPAPEGIALEVSGITLLEDSRPLVCTRRGEVFVVDNAYGETGKKPVCNLLAQGL